MTLCHNVENNHQLKRRNLALSPFTKDDTYRAISWQNRCNTYLSNNAPPCANEVWLPHPVTNNNVALITLFYHYVYKTVIAINVNLRGTLVVRRFVYWHHRVKKKLKCNVHWSQKKRLVLWRSSRNYNSMVVKYYRYKRFLYSVGRSDHTHNRLCK